MEADDGDSVDGSEYERQEHYRRERRFSGRCPYCGGSSGPISRYGDGIDSGISCNISCGWVEEYGADEIPGKRYIAPGEPGSHDKPEDYEPWEGE